VDGLIDDLVDDADVRWPIPPAEGYFAVDLDTIPDLPRHTEPIDGSLVIAGRHAIFHMRTLGALELALTGQAPGEYEAVRGMTVTLGPKQRPEPDLMIVWAAAETSSDQSGLQAGRCPARG
jgi:hypothetical protein